MISPAWVLLVALAGDPDQAGRQFDAGEFDGALHTLDASLEHEASAAKRGALQLLRARCFAALRKNLDADQALESALTEDPTLTLAKLDVSPTFAANFEAIRAKLAAEVSVETDPTGAGVRIDGVLVGPAPARQLLAVGRHEIAVLDTQGQPAASRQVVVFPRRAQTLVLQLKALPVVAASPLQGPAQVDAGTEARDDSWPVLPAAQVRALYDVGGKGVALEAGPCLLGRHFLVELDGVAGGTAGLGLRAGGRIEFFRQLLSAQLTADGVVFFGSKIAPGGGGTFALGLHPVSFLDLLAEVSVRFVDAAPGYASRYGMGGLAVRVRWPFAQL